MALSAATVWEIRPTVGSVNNGGGFVTGATGSDFSQQTSPQYALTGIASAGAGATVLSASAAADMVGNIAKVVSGTNFTVGWYQIISVSVGVSITFDSSVCTGVGASGVINIGGAVASIADIAAVITPGNTINEKNTGTDTLASVTTLNSGTDLLPIVWQGYNSTRGDQEVAITTARGNAGSGALVTTGFPLINFASGGSSRPIVFGDYVSGQFLRLQGDANKQTVLLQTNSVLRRCFVKNAGAGGDAGACQTGISSSVVDCDLTTTSASAPVIINMVSTSRVVFSRIYGTDSSATGVGCGQSTSIISCQIFSCTIGVYNDSANSVSMINTSFNVVQHGIIHTSGLCVAINCVAWGGSGKFYNSGGSVYDTVFANNFTGNFSSSDSTLGGIGEHPARTTLSASPFTSLTGGSEDLRLNNTAGGGASVRAAGFTPYQDGGAIQHDGTATYTAASNVRSGTDRGDGVTGTLVVPAAASVLSTVTFDNGTQGTYVVVTTANVRSGTTFGASSALTGTLAVPAAGNVLNGVAVDNTTGTYVVVAVGNVRNGITFGDASAQTGTLVIPIENDVRDGVDYGASGTEFDGDLVLPAESNVRTGIGYGADGTEFTGTFNGSGGGGTTIPLGG